MLSLKVILFVIITLTSTTVYNGTVAEDDIFKRIHSEL
jgi:hypothetical protein